MSADHKEPNYMAIFVWLTVLTIIEILITRLHTSKVVIAVLLIGFALAKASLVAMFFMHLRFEKQTMAMIAVTPLLLCLFLSLMLLPDSRSRQVLPRAPAPAAAEAPHGE